MTTSQEGQIYPTVIYLNKANSSDTESKKEGKVQESIQSSTTADPGYQWESDNVTDVHESITKQDRNNINDLKKKHRLGTVSKNILLIFGLGLVHNEWQCMHHMVIIPLKDIEIFLGMN